MPVEVRHLVIKATITKDNAPAAKSPDTTSNNAVTPNQELAQLFLERMLAIHHSKNER
jgi:hypothetical protein